MIRQIDQFAYQSRLKRQDPKFKLLFALLTMGVCLWANSVLISLGVLGIMTGVTVKKGGIPLMFWLKLLLIPIAFLILGTISIAVSVSPNKTIFLVSLAVAKLQIGITPVGLTTAGHLFFKSLGAVSCLYYLSLTTPIIDLLQLLRRLKVPQLLVELMGLIYRFIFVLSETAAQMVTAQNSRLGYANLSVGYRSLGTLTATLFIRAYQRSTQLYTALEARGYDGELNVLEETFETHWSDYVRIVGINLFLILGTLLLTHWKRGLF